MAEVLIVVNVLFAAGFNDVLVNITVHLLKEQPQLAGVFERIMALHD